MVSAEGPTKLPQPGRGAAWLDRLRNRYRNDLLEHFLPFMDRHVIDQRFGGFLCFTDAAGRQISREKNSVFEGRGIWLYSYLYRHFGRNPRHLEAARRSAALLLRSRPSDAAAGWPRRLSQNGDPLGPPGTRITNELYIAEGLAELAAAAEEQRHLDLAVELVRSCVDRFDRSDYEPAEGRLFLGDRAPLVPGCRPLSHWSLLLRVAGRLQDLRPMPWQQALADRSLEAIHAHLHPRFGLLNELLRHDLSRSEPPYDQLVSTGNAIAASWSMLYEARRRGAADLFDAAAGHCRRHIEVAWDDVYGGLYRTLMHVDDNRWALDKVAWVQQEALIGLLAVLEGRRHVWAEEWFDRVDAYNARTFSRTKATRSRWKTGTDRTGALDLSPIRVEHYHYPRALIFNLLAVERMAARKPTVNRAHTSVEIDCCP